MASWLLPRGILYSPAARIQGASFENCCGLCYTESIPLRALPGITASIHKISGVVVILEQNDMRFARIWRRAKWIGRGVLFFTPLTSFYMMQFVFGACPGITAWSHPRQLHLHRRCLLPAHCPHQPPAALQPDCPSGLHCLGRCQLLCQPLPGSAHPPLGFHSPAHCGGCGRQL